VFKACQVEASTNQEPAAPHSQKAGRGSAQGEEFVPIWMRGLRQAGSVHAGTSRKKTYRHAHACTAAAEEEPSWSLCQAWSSLIAICWEIGCVVPSKPPLEWGSLQESLSGQGVKGKCTSSSSTISRNLLTHSICPQISQPLTSC